MALSSTVGSLSAPASAGDVTVSGLSFAPKAIIFWGDDQTADGSVTGVAQPNPRYFGFATSTTSRAMISVNCGTTGSSYHANDKVAYLLGAADAVKIDADVTAFTSDGFTLHFTTTTTNTVVNYLALGGADLTNVFVKQFTAPAGTGSQATTGVGFKPDAAIFVSINNTTAPDNKQTPASPYFGIGYATDSTHRGTTSASWNAAPTNYQRTAKCLTVIGDTVQMEADFTSFDSDGFTLNWSTTHSGAYCFALCLKGGSYTVGSFNGKITSTGTAVGASGLSFQPVGELFLSAGSVSSTSSSAVEKLMIGAMVDGTHRAAQTIAVVDTNNHLSALDRTKALAVSGAAASLVTAADYSSQDSGGFTLNYTTVDATAREFLYLAFGNAPATSFIAPAPFIVRQAVKRAAHW